jgi:hypothetical protein
VIAAAMCPAGWCFRMACVLVCGSGDYVRAAAMCPDGFCFRMAGVLVCGFGDCVMAAAMRPDGWCLGWLVFWFAAVVLCDSYCDVPRWLLL